ncbi:MAG: hypothetical protein IT430_08465 [Phycisphaerales bacterium]|nr:hypothetical protein [Phycisphaerales bacterium]
MPRRDQPGAFRRLARRAVLCLLLGAVVQYLVAVGFGVVKSPTIRKRLLAATAQEGDRSLRLEVDCRRAPGKDVLGLVFSVAVGSDLQDVSDYQVWPDWKRLEWQEVIWGQSSGIPTTYLPARPPSWLRPEKVAPRPFPSGVQAPSLSIGIEVGCGWPWRSASYFGRWPWPDRGEFEVEDGLVVENMQSSRTITPRVIPLRIIWPGAIINTLLYVAVLFVPFTLVPITRHHLRRRAGRCTACGYDLRGAAHPVCPECGTPRDRVA